MSNGFFNKVKEGLAGSESGNNYKAVFQSATNPALGKYQFTRGRLSDLGYGNVSNEEFLNNPGLQEEVMDKHLQAAYTHMQKNGIVKGALDGKDAGLLWSYHIGGYGGAQKAAQGLTGPADALGTTPLKYRYKGQKAFDGTKGALLVDEPTPNFQPLDMTRPLPNTIASGAAFASSFKRDDIYTAGFNLIQDKPLFQFDPQYNPFDAEDINKYEAIWDKLETSNNEEESKYHKKQYDQFVEDSRNQAEGGGASLAGAGLAGLVSPLNFIPGMGLLSKGMRTAKVLKSTKKLAGIGAGITGGIVAAEEGILQLHDPTRQASESVAAVLTAGAIGALITPLIVRKYASRAIQKDLQNQVSDSIETNAQKEFNKGSPDRLPFDDCDY